MSLVTHSLSQKGIMTVLISLNSSMLSMMLNFECIEDIECRIWDFEEEEITGEARWKNYFQAIYFYNTTTEASTKPFDLYEF